MIRFNFWFKVSLASNLITINRIHILALCSLYHAIVKHKIEGMVYGGSIVRLERCYTYTQFVFTEKNLNDRNLNRLRAVSKYQKR